MKNDLFFCFRIFQKEKKILISIFLMVIFFSWVMFLTLKKKNVGHKKVEQKEKNIILKKNAVLPLSNKELDLGLFDLSFSSFCKKLKMKLIEANPTEKNPYYLEVEIDGTGQKIVNFGERFYLKYNFSKKRYEFCSSPTLFWINFHLGKKKEINAVINAKYIDVSGKEQQQKEKLKMFVEEKKTKNNGDIFFLENKEFNVFKEAKWIEKDCLLELYSQENSKKDRIVLSSDEILFFNKKDSFIFKDNKWEKVENLTESRGYSLAHIKEVNNSFLKINLWAKGQNKKQTLNLKKDFRAHSLPTNKEFISDIHLRTKKQISCKVGDQRLILKEKEPIIKKEGKWRVSKKINFKNIEPEGLFLFDKVEMKGREVFFTGYLFNKYRTKCIKIEKNINIKTNNHIRNKKTP